MPDPRVLLFWDAERFAGPWFAKTVTGESGYMWDAYLLYGPNARWDAAPGPLIDSGGTIIDAVGAVLQKMSDVDYDSAGNVVGFGVSLMPTAHQFTVNGQTLYTWCALDTFLYTALLDLPAHVVSHCPVTARPIALAMTPQGISELTPASTAISLVIPNGSVADCRRSAFCNHGHFFATAEVGATWLHDHPDGIILSVADAHRLGRLLADHRMLLARHRVTEYGEHP